MWSISSYFSVERSRFVSARVLGVLLSIGVLSGCASISRDGSYQTVLVRTESEGASIYVDNVLVGQSPEFIEVRRSQSPLIQIETASGRMQVSLESRYRWSKSFGRNLIFLTYAPIGWAIDFLTGTAWEVQDSYPYPVKLSKEDRERQLKKKGDVRVAVAPPIAESVALSDAGGRALEERLRLSNETKIKGEILSYDKTLLTFLDSDYDYERGDESSRRKLYRDLKVDFIYESRIDRGADGSWLLSSRRQATRSTSVAPGPSFEIATDQLGPRVFGYGMGLKSWWSRILPDTVGLDVVNDHVRVELLGTVYDLESVRPEEWWASGLEYLSAINVSSTPDWRRSAGSRWVANAVPSFRVSRKNVRARNLPPPSNGQFIEKDPLFARWSLSGGYGLEVGYLFGRHFVYMDMIPVFNWSEVSWRQNSERRSATRTTITAMVELGYTYIFDSNWLVRVFSRSQGENNEVWRDAFRSRLGDEYSPTSTTGVVSGLTVGYRFDSVGFHKTEPSARP